MKPRPEQSGGKAVAPPGGAEKLARAALVFSAALILIPIALLLIGSVYTPQSESFPALLLADRMVLLWITLLSTAHLVFVPAFCISIALRDARRVAAGKPVPYPRSVWSGHRSVFEGSDRPS